MINLNGAEEQDWGAARVCVRMTDSESEGAPPPEGTDHELEDAARDERDYLRQRLLEELGREPTQEELDDWLRQHTEGYLMTSTARAAAGFGCPCLAAGQSTHTTARRDHLDRGALLPLRMRGSGLRLLG